MTKTRKTLGILAALLLVAVVGVVVIDYRLERNFQADLDPWR